MFHRLVLEAFVKCVFSVFHRAIFTLIASFLCMLLNPFIAWWVYPSMYCISKYYLQDWYITNFNMTFFKIKNGVSTITALLLFPRLLPFPSKNFTLINTFFMSELIVFKLGHNNPLDKTFKKIRLNLTLTYKWPSPLMSNYWILNFDQTKNPFGEVHWVWPWLINYFELEGQLLYFCVAWLGDI